MIAHFLPLKGKPSSLKGHSEKQIRQHLEKQGYLVWRTQSLGIENKEDAYPNVKRKYQLLTKLLKKHTTHLEYLSYLNSIHHGLPDFIIYKNRQFKFIECKLGYEQLSKRQKLCIEKLTKLNFNVEVYKVVFTATKVRKAKINLETGEKEILEKQLILA